jgi:muramidase (phage lysozyme)
MVKQYIRGRHLHRKFGWRLMAILTLSNSINISLFGIRCLWVKSRQQYFTPICNSFQAPALREIVASIRHRESNTVAPPAVICGGSHTESFSNVKARIPILFL